MNLSAKRMHVIQTEHRYLQYKGLKFVQSQVQIDRFVGMNTGYWCNESSADSNFFHMDHKRRCNTNSRHNEDSRFLLDSQQQRWARWFPYTTLSRPCHLLLGFSSSLQLRGNFMHSKAIIEIAQVMCWESWLYNYDILTDSINVQIPCHNLQC